MGGGGGDERMGCQESPHEPRLFRALYHVICGRFNAEAVELYALRGGI